VIQWSGEPPPDDELGPRGKLLTTLYLVRLDPNNEHSICLGSVHGERGWIPGLASDETQRTWRYGMSSGPHLKGERTCRETMDLVEDLVLSVEERLALLSQRSDVPSPKIPAVDSVKAMLLLKAVVRAIETSGDQPLPPDLQQLIIDFCRQV